MDGTFSHATLVADNVHLRSSPICSLLRIHVRPCTKFRKMTREQPHSKLAANAGVACVDRFSFLTFSRDANVMSTVEIPAP